MNKSKSIWIAVIAVVGALAVIGIIYVAQNSSVPVGNEDLQGTGFEMGSSTGMLMEDTDAIESGVVEFEMGSSTGVGAGAMYATYTTSDSAKALARSNYVNLTLKDAEKLAKSKNTPFRVVELDGKGLPVSADFRPGRINATVKNGVVVDISVE